MKTGLYDILRSTHRKGVEDLITFLNQSDFFEAPCSTKFHLACKGGLFTHSINVLNCALTINERYNFLYKTENIILSAIGHDLCKVNFYKEIDEPPTDAQAKYLISLFSKAGIRPPSKLNRGYVSILIDFMLKKYKVGVEIPPFTPSYTVEDQLPLGHGEKSLYIMEQFVELTPDEAMAIRWHMASFDAGIHFAYPSGFAYNEAVKRSKLVTIITIADMEASNLLE